MHNPIVNANYIDFQSPKQKNPTISVYPLQYATTYGSMHCWMQIKQSQKVQSVGPKFPGSSHFLYPLFILLEFALQHHDLCINHKTRM